MATEGIDPTFLARVQAMQAAAPGKISIGSGFRTNAQQAALYKAKPGLAAKPGHSKHEKGMAIDFVFEGGQEGAVAKWVHANAARFGISFPMAERRPGKKYEPWHGEMAGATMKFVSDVALDPSQVVDLRGQPGASADPNNRNDIGVQIGSFLSVLDNPVDFSAQVA